MMLVVSIVCTFAVLATSVAAQSDSLIIEGCTSSEVETFIAALPNSEACNSSLINFFSPENLTEVEYTAMLQTFCSVDCGGSIVELAVTNCRDLVFANLLHVFCLPLENREDRCRSVGPDLLENGEALISDLASCSSFDGTTCPAGCANALTAGANQLDCCYQDVYNNTWLLDWFTEVELLSAQEAQTLQVTRQGSLWEACSVNLTLRCMGEPFPGTSSLAIGVCTEAQQNTFYFSLGADCLGNITAAFGPLNPPESLFDNGVCLPSCSGELASFFERVCLDEYAKLSSEQNCLHTDGELASRCFYSNPIVGPNGAATARADFFAQARNTCLADPTADLSGPCPSGCQAALQEVKRQLGCCYQNIYNNSQTVDSLYILDVITVDEYLFFNALGTQALWESCGVSLQMECTGDPYGPAPTRAPSGVLQLGASTLMMVCAVGISLNLY